MGNARKIGATKRKAATRRLPVHHPEFDNPAFVSSAGDSYGFDIAISNGC